MTVILGWSVGGRGEWDLRDIPKEEWAGFGS